MPQYVRPLVQMLDEICARVYVEASKKKVEATPTPAATKKEPKMEEEKLD